MAEQAVIVRNESQMAMLRQAGMLIGIAASVALGLYVVMWARTPNYAMLYSNLADKDVTQVADALAGADIRYRLGPGAGSIMVPSGSVEDARLKLAAAGLPKSSGTGFELLDEDQGFGTSQFLERARYQRAIEGELSRSIGRINSVRGARVHLALSPETVFARAKRPPSASVIVDLYQGRRLAPEQVAAIVHLVSASVPNLPVSQVTVVDQQGNLLTEESGDDDMRLTTKRFDHTQRIEQSYMTRIEKILAPLVGVDGVRAQVTADIDYTATEQTRESFNPDLPAVRSERLIEEDRAAAGTAGGVPGALSNQPPGAATAPEEIANATPGGEEDGQTVSAPAEKRTLQSTRNYELDRTISHTKPSIGALRRLSVAVVVRNPVPEAPAKKSGKSKKGKDAADEQAPLEYTPEQLERMTSLVKEAVGFDAARGDTVQISAVEFIRPPAPEPLPEPPIWQQAWVWDVAKQALGGLFVLFLLFGVLKPAIKSLMARSDPAARLLAQAAAGAAALPGAMGGAAGAGLPALSQAQQLAGPAPFDGNVDQVKQFVNQDPKVAAQVVRGWVGEGR